MKNLIQIFSSLFKDLINNFVFEKQRHPANTGKPIVAVLINAPAKIIKGSKGYFSNMETLALCYR